ncbi:MAG: sedoheptulose 7-phosphate cyclase [Fibrobacteria bacterium]|nr:sedoheptulose 7-phosphate cyclase [Fibrobacteria bacterium]
MKKPEQNELKEGRWTVKTELSVEYEIKNSPNILNPSNPDLLCHGTQGIGKRRLIIAERTVCHHYFHDIRNYFEKNHTNYHIVPVDLTEENKNLDSLLYILGEIEQFGVLRRSEPLIAIGGGVLLDVVGLAASLYRRGIPYIKVPTTLIGLIDASVGVKTGINFENRRNRLGSYAPPIAAYLDKSFLKTLPELEFRSGVGEIIKMAVVKDLHLFELLEQASSELVDKKFNGCPFADEIINRSVTGMKDELQENLWEKILKRQVDFGHSFSPIIEMRSIHDKGEQPLTHGQAVTLDILLSCIISRNRKMLTKGELNRVFKLIKNTGLPTEHQLCYNPLVILEALEDTVKHRNGDQNLPIPVTIGKSTFLNDVTFKEIKKAVQSMKQLNMEFKK